MKKNKFLGVILGIAIFCGIACSGIILAIGIKNASTVSANAPKMEKYPQPHTLEKTELEEFSEASIDLDYADVSILPSDGFYLEYRLDGACEKPDYNVTNGKFHFQEGATLQRYMVSLNLFSNARNQGPYFMNLYVPKDQYFELLSLSMESGNAELEQIHAKNAELSLDYGNLNLEAFTGTALEISLESGNLESKSITCGDLSVSASYGDFTGDTVSVSGDCGIDMESGNLGLASLTAGSFSVNNAYGNCDIGKITADNCICSLESGNITLKNAALGHADINVAYGDATLRMAGKISDYNYNLETEYGEIEFNRKHIEANEDGVSAYQSQGGKKDKEVQIYCESGNVKIRE